MARIESRGSPAVRSYTIAPVCGPARFRVFVIAAPRPSIAGVAGGAFGLAGWAGCVVVVVVVVFTAIGEPTEASELGLAT